MVTIKNNFIEISVNEHGAQLCSLKKNGKQFLWQGDEKWWEDTAPVLFPICSNLKNGKYKFDGKEYSMPSHGFSKNLDFEIESFSESSVRLTARSDDYTRGMYPFEFVFSVEFSLEDNVLVTKYITENPSDKDMFYSVGSHEGYNCPEGVENYSVIFNKTESFDACILDGPILSYEKEKLLPDGKRIELKSEYFEIDAIILEKIKSDEISLVNKKTGESIKVELADFTNLLIWSIPGAPFVCLEAWCGFPDYVDTDGDFTKKHSIIKLAPHSIDVKTHKIYL